MVKHFSVTILVLVASLFLFEFTSIDVEIQNKLFNFDLNQWLLDRNNYLTRLLFYDGIKKLFLVLVLTMLVVLIFFRKRQIVQEYRHGLTILLLAAVLVPLSIGSLKAITNVPCPRDIDNYGGTYPHVTVFSSYPKNFHQAKRIQCYPAGHASGAFAFMAVFFLFKKRRNRIVALTCAISVGWIVGFYKMSIGDHFFSHTFITMNLAWLIIIMTKAGLDYAGRATTEFNLKYSLPAAPALATSKVYLDKKGPVTNNGYN